MNATEFKRHWLNHMAYSSAYFTAAAGEECGANRVSLAEAASHAMACCWCMADALREGQITAAEAAEAIESIGFRWAGAVERWSRQLPSNRARAYAAPIRERRALREWPTGAEATGIPTTKGTRSHGATATRGGATAGVPTAQSSPATGGAGSTAAEEGDTWGTN